MDSTQGLQDENLRDRVLAFPESGWEVLWKTYGGDIRYRISRFRLSLEDVEEALQEFSYRIAKDDFRLLKAWDPDRCSLKGYLCLIATSCCLDFLKSSFYRQKSLFKDPDWGDSCGDLQIEQFEDEDLHPDQRLHRTEVLAKVRDCLVDWRTHGRLKVRDRLLLELRLAGAGFEEIAKTLGVSREAATKQFSRLRKELQKRLENRGITITDAETLKKKSHN